MQSKQKWWLLPMLFSAFSWAQQPVAYYEPGSNLKHAENLYLLETYKATQHAFDKIVDHKNTSIHDEEAARFYAAITALINQQPAAEKKWDQFQKDHPRSLYTQNAAWELGSYYLGKGDYEQALYYLKQNNIHSLPTRKQDAYRFKLGFAQMMQGNESQALRMLEPLTASETYGKEATYYTGHLYYAQGKFDQAFTYFDQLRTDYPEFEDKVLPYVVQIQFNNQEYEKAIANGKTLLTQTNDSFLQSEISKIIGESYFALGDYDQALPYLEAYTGELSNADYYQLGYTYYQKGNFEKAISLFNKIVGETNPLAQTAYYQLGNAYLQTDKKKEALSAFQSSSAMNFDTSIQKDAYYNYAKLSYEIGNPFEGTPEVLQNYLTKYPNSKEKSEIQNYLIDAYLSSGNYQSALDALDKIPNKSQDQLSAQQWAAFLLGTQYFTQGSIAQAQPYLNKAAQMTQDVEVQARAAFWSGETDYRLGKYNQALKWFTQFDQLNQQVPESVELPYQLAYTYLKLKNYDQAIVQFKRYLASNPKGEFESDAKLRLADSFVGNKNLNEALKLYNEVGQTQNTQSAEAAYNYAYVLGIKGDYEGKIAALQGFLKQFPDSTYAERARLELADAYLRTDNSLQAEQNLDDLIRNGSPEMTARARIKKGEIYYNQSKDRQALAEFKRVAEDYPETELALQAIDKAKQIYIKQNNISGFEKWASKLNYYQVDSNELENLAFDEAALAYQKGDFENAIARLSAFVQKYPRSAYFAKATYWLGESYYQTNEYAKSVTPLTSSAKLEHPQQEDALLRLAQVYLQQNETTEALLALEALHQKAKNEAYRSYAEVHLMRIYSDRGVHDKALQMAKNVEQNPKNEYALKQEAQLISARSLMSQKKKKDAQQVYAELENAQSAAVRAEALYYKAYFLNQDKKYDASNEVIFDLASNYAAQQYWGSKSLVVMARNYHALNDTYQATYTLEKVIENYAEYQDVVAEAEQLLNEIKSK